MGNEVMGVQVHDVQYGRTTRKSFARIPDILEMPNLIEVQKKSSPLQTILAIWAKTAC